MKTAASTMGQTLSKSTLFDGAIPFDKLNENEFLPALREEMSLARQRLESMKADPAEPTFENTILIFETFAETVEMISTVFGNLFSCEATEEIKKVSKDMALEQAGFSSDLFLDAKIFEKVERLCKNNSSLNEEQKRLLTETYRSFVRNGASLNDSKKARIRDLDQELAKLTTQFKENVQEASNQFLHFVTDEKDLAGLPDELKASLKADAQKRGRPDAWAVSIHAPIYIPVMEMSTNPKLREALYMAYNGKCMNGPYDNREVIKKIVTLRSERAKLLGFSSHAEFVLDDRMVQKVSTAEKFLERLRGVSKSAAEREVKELSHYKSKHFGTSDVKPWDTGFLIEKITQEKYDINQEELRPYFGASRVLNGVFEVAQRLYGLEFKVRKDIPTYHKDVQVFEAHRKGSGYTGLLYVDLYQRDSKKSGAWMTQFRNQGLFQGKVCRPHISIVMNFNKSATGETYLRFDDVNTLFHEFGHALHGLLSNVTYRSLGGTSVTWDFVELPSQFMENWLLEKEVFYSIAKHGTTGESLPEVTYKKLVESQKFMAGWMSVRQVQFALLDLAWHTLETPFDQDVVEFEKTATASTRLLPPVEGVCFSTSFQHIFSGGYSAGYYSYKWAEVLDADAFEYFKTNGLFNAKIAESFYENILSKGNTEDAMVLYKKFRGREPDPDALLRRSGLMGA